MLEGDAAQGAEENVGEGGEPQTQLIGAHGRQFAKANCATIRLKLLKIGALVRVSVRRIKLAMASSFPNQREYRIAHRRGAVGEQIELAFLDAVLHVAAGAIELLVEAPRVRLLFAERGGR